MIRGASFLLVALAFLVGVGPDVTGASRDARAQAVTIPVMVAWNGGTTDGVMVGATDLRLLEGGADWVDIRTEGAIFAEDLVGTAALKLFYHPERRDYATVVTATSERALLAAGYQFVAVEGYVYPTLHFDSNGFMPLKLFWSEANHDYVTVVIARSEQGLLAAGYTVVGIEGYVIAVP